MAKEQAVKLSEDLFNLLSDGGITTFSQLSQAQAIEFRKRLFPHETTFIGEQLGGLSKKKSIEKIYTAKIASEENPEVHVTVVIVHGSFIVVYTSNNFTSKIKKLYCNCFFDKSKIRA